MSCRTVSKIAAVVAGLTVALVLALQTPAPPAEPDVAPQVRPALARVATSLEVAVTVPAEPPTEVPATTSTAPAPPVEDTEPVPPVRPSAPASVGPVPAVAAPVAPAAVVAAERPTPVAESAALDPAADPPKASSVVDAAVARIGYPWQRLGYELVVEPARPGLLGNTTSVPKRITLYVGPGMTVDTVAFVLAHEIGHAIDFSYGTRALRSEWMVARGVDPASPWYGCDDCDDLATPAGDFAESFAAWQVGPGRLYSSRLGAPPDVGHQALLAVISRV